MSNWSGGFSETASAILRFRDFAWDSYHTSEKYLDLMKKKFGNKAYEELNATKKIKLKRRLFEESKTEQVV